MADSRDDVGTAIPGPQTTMDTVFFRELAEAYLLIDYISSQRDRRLPAAIDLDGDGQPDKGDWMAAICELTWPPEGDAKAITHQAEFLIRTRDALNRIAAPATGASIAFTILAVDEDLPRTQDVTDSSGAGPASEVVRLSPWRSLVRRQPSPRRPSQRGIRPVRDSITGLTRYDLALQAFPNLKRPAVRFRRFNRILIFLLFAWLIVTLSLSWNVASGNNLLGQVHTARIEAEEFDKTIPALQAGALAVVSSDTAPTLRNNALIETVKHQLYLQHRVEATRDNLASWAAVWPAAAAWPWITRPAAHADAGSGPGRQEREAIGASLWAATLLNTLSNSVLPVFYGLLGAGAAVVRGLSGKMRDSSLAPRDLMFSLIQLALGATIGACIGLFVAPAGTDLKNAPGLVGSAQLSASAWSFLAGFGVEHVIIVLEALLARIISVPDGPKKTA